MPLTEAKVSTFAHADGTTWSAQEILPAPGYAATVVGQGANWRLRFFDWSATDSVVNTPQRAARTRFHLPANLAR
jgi:hypothetical protein